MRVVPFPEPMRGVRASVTPSRPSRNVDLLSRNLGILPSCALERADLEPRRSQHTRVRRGRARFGVVLVAQRQKRQGEEPHVAHAATRAQTETEEAAAHTHRHPHTQAPAHTGTARTGTARTGTNSASPTSPPPPRPRTLCLREHVRCSCAFHLQQPSAFPSLSKLHAQQCLCPLA